MTTSLLIYDIPLDKLRKKVANACLDYGLQRIQYSAFQGVLTHNRQEELLQRIRRIMGPHAVNVAVFPVCEKDLRCATHWIQTEPEKRDEGSGQRAAGSREGDGDQGRERHKWLNADG